MADEVVDRIRRVEALWKRALWIDEKIGSLAMPTVSPAVLKTLLVEFREYSKQVALEQGDWQERKDATSGGRPSQASHPPQGRGTPIFFNLSVLSGEELRSFETLRRKLQIPFSSGAIEVTSAQPPPDGE